MTDAEFAELRALWDASSIEVRMDPPKPRDEPGQVVLRDVEFETVALVYDAGHDPGTTEGAMANAKLIAWLLDHSWAIVYDDADVARREVVAQARALLDIDEAPILDPLRTSIKRLDSAEAEERRQGRTKP